jgi:anaerobic selenocysteine-containing dehydrogenase
MALRTACTYDCPDACGLVLDDEGGQPRLQGDPEHPITRGFTCQRVRRHLARLSHPSRLKAPRVRDGERFKEAGWDAALDLAAQKLAQALKEGGPASVVHVQGGGSLGISKELVGHFFRSLGPVTTVRGGACGEAGEEAQRLDFGDCADHDYSDLENSRAVVLWGKNPVETGPHLVPFVNEARARKAPVVLVEVRPTPSEKLADRVIRVAQGGDGFLALSVLRLLERRRQLEPDGLKRVEWPRLKGLYGVLSQRDEEGWAALAGASMADVEYLGELYRGRRPVATWIGWGLQRRRCGGASVRCIDALGVLTGNVGVAGGGVNFTSWRRRGLARSLLAEATGRTIAAPRFARDLGALAEPPARFVYLCAANPVASLADSRATARALRGAGFVVVADAFQTDTADCADLVLPVALMLEEDDVTGSYAHHHVARVRKVVEPPEGVRSDVWIVRELARRLGRESDPLLEDTERALARLTAAWLPDGDAVTRNPAHTPVPFEEWFTTPSGKARLLDRAPEIAPADAEFPLALLTPSHQAWQTSQLPEEMQTEPVECFVHPSSAVGIASGARARLVTSLGALEVTVRLDPELAPGMAVVHRGGALRLGRAANSLVPQQATDVGEGTAFYDARARLEPAAD